MRQQKQRQTKKIVTSCKTDASRWWKSTVIAPNVQKTNPKCSKISERKKKGGGGGALYKTQIIYCGTHLLRRPLKPVKVKRRWSLGWFLVSGSATWKLFPKHFRRKKRKRKKVVSKWLISLYQGFLHSVHLSAPLPTVINDNTSRVLGQWFSYMETNM